MTTPKRDDTPLVVRHVFPAARDRVFRAWVEADAMRHWFRPGDNRLTDIVLDLRVGGRIRLDLLSPDGRRTRIEGEFVEIVRPEKLRFTWVSDSTGGEETLVTVQFVERGDTTEIVLTHERLTDDTRPAHQAGWTMCLNLLAAYVSA